MCATFANLKVFILRLKSLWLVSLFRQLNIYKVGGVVIYPQIFILFGFFFLFDSCAFAEPDALSINLYHYSVKFLH